MIISPRTPKCGFRKSLMALSIGFSILFSANSFATSINSQLDNMFGSMSNVTAPGDYQSVTRDGYTGGGFVLRNKLRTLTPVT
ncbi:TPA: conjugal transfer protein TraH, partial [Enterobacter ludwigii]